MGRLAPKGVTVAESIEDIHAEASSWAEDNWDPDLTVAAWWDRLLEARYSLPTLPESAYGRGYSRVEGQAVFRAFAEIGTLGPPGGIATMMAAPTIAEHGTAEQIDRFIPPILTGRETWCQLFSEPGAGSDLAGLQTRAVRDGDEWTITGQKVWTSLATDADLGMLLARTDPARPKHAGITWFAFPMVQDGITIRPLREMTGHSMFNEVFIDDALVGDDAVIGAEGDGWRVGNTTLMHERGSLAGSVVRLAFARGGSVNGDLDRRAGDFGMFDEMGESTASAAEPVAVRHGRLARENGHADDAVLRDRLADLHITMEVNRLCGLRARTGAIPAIGNIGKLAMSEIARRTREAGNQAIGAAGMLTGDDAAAGPGGGDVQRQTLHSPAPSIYGGTDQVQRNIVGERILGLPKEPGPAKDTPFRDLPHN